MAKKRVNTYGGAPTLGTVWGEPVSNPDFSREGGYGGAPTILPTRVANSGPSSTETYPRAYGGAPTMMRQAAGKNSKGGGANTGGGSTSTAPS